MDYPASLKELINQFKNDHQIDLTKGFYYNFDDEEKVLYMVPIDYYDREKKLYPYYCFGDLILFNGNNMVRRVFSRYDIEETAPCVFKSLTNTLLTAKNMILRHLDANPLYHLNSDLTG